MCICKHICHYDVRRALSCDSVKETIGESSSECWENDKQRHRHTETDTDTLRDRHRDTKRQTKRHQDKQRETETGREGQI